MRQTVGVVLIILGMLVSVAAFEHFTNTVCHCPVEEVGKPYTCPCVENGRHLAYSVSFVGLGISFSGIIFFSISFFKKGIKSL